MVISLLKIPYIQHIYVCMYGFDHPWSLVILCANLRRRGRVRNTFASVLMVKPRLAQDTTANNLQSVLSSIRIGLDFK